MNIQISDKILDTKGWTTGTFSIFDEKGVLIGDSYDDYESNGATDLKMFVQELVNRGALTIIS